MSVAKPTDAIKITLIHLIIFKRAKAKKNLILKGNRSYCFSCGTLNLKQILFQIIIPPYANCTV